MSGDSAIHTDGQVLLLKAHLLELKPMVKILEELEKFDSALEDFSHEELEKIIRRTRVAAIACLKVYRDAVAELPEELK